MTQQIDHMMQTFSEKCLVWIEVMPKLIADWGTGTVPLKQLQM